MREIPNIKYMKQKVYNFKFKIMGGGNSKEKVIENKAAKGKA